MRVGIVTLGCDKNTVDNEYLAGLLEDAGCEVVATRPAGDGTPLDAVVVTTCGFIGDAQQQSVDTLVALAERKRTTGDPRRLYVAGCLAQRYADQLQAELPELDGLVGVGQFARLAELILAGAQADGAAVPFNEVGNKPTVDIYRFMRRRRLERRPHAFLKISDGCNHACTFCSIPSMKGKLRSVPPEIVLAEARQLLGEGVRELNLVAQDLSMYGMDRWKNYGLPELLRELCALPGDFWVRCLYVYPGLVTDRLIEVLASEPKIVPYLDMPLQHLDPGVLRRMKRPFHEVNTAGLIARLRAAIPGLALRTTMIVGFPGETPAEHRRMLDGIEALQFERLGAFQYSREDGTPAAEAPRPVGSRTRSRRWHAVMAAQARIAAAYHARRVGERTRVLIERYDPERAAWCGRSPAEAPEIDGQVFVRAAEGLAPGMFVPVEITQAETYDVTAEVRDASTGLSQMIPDAACRG